MYFTSVAKKRINRTQIKSVIQHSSIFKIYAVDTNLIATLLPSITTGRNTWTVLEGSDWLSGTSKGPSVGLLSHEPPLWAPNLISSARSSFWSGDGPNFCNAACTSFSVYPNFNANSTLWTIKSIGMKMQAIWTLEAAAGNNSFESLSLVPWLNRKLF